MPVVIGIAIALLVAAAVLLLAGAMARQDGAGSDESPWQAFRRGLAARRNPQPDQLAAARAAEQEPVDMSLADFLRATADDGEPYLHVDDLSEGLRYAGRRAARALPGHSGHKSA